MKDLKRRLLELGMTCLLLAGVFCLSREGARMAGKISPGGPVVVIDAGHGGMDPGKVGVNQAYEKDINLAIAQKLKEDLEAEEVQVVMSREEDAGLYQESSSNKKLEDMKNRVLLIHETQPDCAVSIHQNSYTEASVSGAQVFYYEDSVEGKKLAEILQEKLSGVMEQESRREAKGNTSYYLLKKTDCPLTIVECGFLSNPREAELLTQEDYQEKMAEAICGGILEYLEQKGAFADSPAEELP